MKYKVTLENGEVHTRTSDRDYKYVVYALVDLGKDTTVAMDQYARQTILWSQSEHAAHKAAQATRSGIARVNKYRAQEGKGPYKIIKVVVQEVTA